MIRVGRRKLSDRPKGYGRQMKGLSIKKDKFHGEWNYTIRPKKLILGIGYFGEPPK